MIKALVTFVETMLTTDVNLEYFEKAEAYLLSPYLDV